MAIILSQHRNLIIAVLACYLIFLLINWGLRFKSLVLGTVVGLLFIVSVNLFLKDRFSQGMEDVTTTTFDISSPDFYNVNLSELTTTEFRQLLLMERVDFILKDKMHTLFGIGLLTDDSRQAARLNFNIGMSDGYGNVAQVASSDIAWSALLLQTGFAGVAIFILVHLFLSIFFFKERHSPVMLTGFLYILCLLFTSFYSNMIVLPFVTMLLMLYAAYYYKVKAH